MEMESSSAKSCVPGERSVAGKISMVGGTGKAVAAVATSGKKTSLQALLATTGKKASLQELLATTGNKTSKQELLATAGKTFKQESVKTARSEVRKAALLLWQLASLRGRAGDVSLRESRERLIGQSMEALSNAEILASLEEKDARRAAQEAKTDPNAYQVCDQEEDQQETLELLMQNMADDADEYVKCEATAPEEAYDPAFILENDMMTMILADEEAGRKIAHEASTGPNAYQACAQSDDDWSDKEEQHEVMEFLKQNMADDYDESAKFEAAAPEEATEDGIRVMRISEESAEVAAEEEMMMMGFGGLAEEAAEELTKSGEQNKRRRRGNRSTHELMVAAREKEGKRPQEAYTDPNAYEARGHRIDWDWIFAPLYGPFDQITSIPPSCFTHYRFPNPYARPQETLQIFSIKVVKIKKPLKWPLHVFGSVAVRDVVDHNRIMVFHRERENCQTLIKKDRFLTLTGPTRGVVVDVHPTYIEVDLKVKGATELEDMDLSYLVVRSMPSSPSYRAVPSKLSTLELSYVRMYHCVEAAISVKVKKHGLWPGCRGLFTASTASYEDMEVLLLAFEGDKLPVDASGRIELSRCVVSVELPQHEGKLVFSAKAPHGSDEKNVRRVRTFTPKRAGKSKENIKIGSCEMEVTVTWSLLPSYKVDYDKSLERA